MSYDDGLGLLGGGGELSHDAAVLQQAVGTRKQRRAKGVNKVTVIYMKQPGGFAATATVGGGLFGGGQKKQFAAGSLGEIFTQVGNSVRKAFSFGAQPQVVMQPQQQYPQYRPQPPLQQQAPVPIPQTQATKKCQNCRAEIPNSAKFCNECGEKYVIPPRPKFCTTCGAQKAKPEVRFCSECGAQQD